MLFTAIQEAQQSPWIHCGRRGVFYGFYGSRGSHVASIARLLVRPSFVASFYIGATSRNPCARWQLVPEDGSLPHCQKYDRMYPLWVGSGRDAVSLERLLIGEWRWDPRCLNIRPGGEGVRRRAHVR